MVANRNLNDVIGPDFIPAPTNVWSPDYNNEGDGRILTDFEG
jgi:hypothetical protein